MARRPGRRPCGCPHTCWHSIPSAPLPRSRSAGVRQRGAQVPAAGELEAVGHPGSDAQQSVDVGGVDGAPEQEALSLAAPEVPQQP